MTPFNCSNEEIIFDGLAFFDAIAKLKNESNCPGSPNY